ncbi:hypothetical protein SCLCIDRAFT_29831 [Scleroderma citrinum Foug A]|uniref:Uncharacterized protein n=1 Tax=Scleroderma citrinum Foug A TaxID=1036808 RepID=A0A0C3DJA6_9AGAM|nr:hypothetical protein SCLCIDRAFT_29831 [Scleroderma citrinum Foug A]
MSDICGRKPSRSPSPSAHHKCARDLSDKPMSPGDGAHCHSDKRRAAHLPSPRHRQSPSHEGHHEKCHQVTLHDNSPPSTQWVATTTGLLIHNPRDHCPECLEYQRHVSLDLILETLSIMVACEDSLKSLARLLGWSGHMANLKDDLAEMHHDRDHWRRQAEEAEMSPGTIFSKMNVDEPTVPPPSGSLLAGWLEEVEETMFPLLGQGEVPNRVSVLLDSTRYLHVQVGNSLYQFESPARESIVHNIDTCVPPPLMGANPPGTVHLFNTVDELNELNTQVAQESDERDSPNTRMGQRLVAWLNKYLGDMDHMTRAKPSKNCVVSHVLTKWRPPAWVMSHSKNKCEEYRKAHQAAHDGTHVQCGAPPPPLSFVPEAQQPPAASVSFSILKVPQLPAASSSSSSTAPTMACPRLFRRSRNTNRQDGLPKGAPGWGDELAECKMTKKFLGIQVETDPGFVEPLSDRRLRGFILKGYFAPRFQYDSNHNEGWVIVPSRSSRWTEAVDWAPSPLAIAGYLAQNSLSFQEAGDLYEWATAALHKDAMGQEADADITLDLLIAGTSIEGSERSLEYYEERAKQGGSQLEFRDIESLPGNTLSPLRVKEAARYLPAPPQKKKCHSYRKTMDTDKEDSYSSFSEDSLGSDDSGLLWNPPKDDQMDVNNSGPLQM